MKLSPEQARELAVRAVMSTEADGAEAVVISSESALTRFATNHIHQNVAEADTQVSLRAVAAKVGSRVHCARRERLSRKRRNLQSNALRKTTRLKS